MGASQSPAGRAGGGRDARRGGRARRARPLVFFNDGWVPYDGARELAARGGLRDLDPPRAPRDALRVPHPAARLLLGRACRWSARRATTSSALVEREDVGAAVPEGDHAAVAAALERVLTQGRAAYAPRLAQVARVVRLAAGRRAARALRGGRRAAETRGPAAGWAASGTRGPRRRLPDGARDAQRRRPAGLADALARRANVIAITIGRVPRPSGNSARGRTRARPAGRDRRRPVDPGAGCPG